VAAKTVAGKAAIRAHGRPATVGTYVVLSIAAVAAIAPFFFLLVTAFTHTYVEQVAISKLAHPTLANFRDIFSQTPFGRWLINSFVVAAATTVLVLFVDSLAGYAFAKKKFVGRDVVFFMLLSTQMIPIPVTILPLFLLATRMGLIDSYYALVLPAVAVPIGVFMMRQFIKTIPSELEEAARIDGLGDLAIYWKIILPLCIPALALLGFFTFFASWTSLLWPLLVATSDHSRTIPPGLASLVGQYITNYGQISAGAVLSIIPMVLVFVLLARQLARGLVSRTVKG
jgi:multiple sugar transport system permease protein